MKNVPYTVTGGAGAELVGKNPDHDFYHYIKVHVNDNNVSYELVKLDSPDFNFIDRVFAVYTYTLTLSLISGLYTFDFNFNSFKFIS